MTDKEVKRNVEQMNTQKEEPLYFYNGKPVFMRDILREQMLAQWDVIDRCQAISFVSLALAVVALVLAFVR